MFSYDYVVAAVLLTSPVESPELSAHLEFLQPSLLQAAIDAEILDEREERYLLGLSREVRSDLNVLRRRFEHFLSAPPIAEGERFPDRKRIEDLMAFNREYRKELQAELQAGPAGGDDLRLAIAEVDQLYHLWSVLRDARCRFYYVTVRRESLRQLHDLLGANAFYRAELPPHAPIWHFPRLK